VASLSFVGPDTPSAEDLHNCIHCGFCLPSCPTYIATGHELESPRGRLHLIESVRSGRIDASSQLLGHLDLCLQCRACETACPSAVPYGRIMEDARASIMAHPARRQPRSWWLRACVLRHVIAKPRILRAALFPARLYSRSGLQRLVRGKLASRLPKSLARLESLSPDLGRNPYRQRGTLTSPAEPKARVALLAGCVHGEFFPQTHEATIRVLAALNCEVVAPPDQSCCGALHQHAGDASTGRDLARNNIVAFKRAGVDAVIVNAAGCGAAMKEYGHLLRDDRAILGAIPELRLNEMKTPDRCCGSAGLYSAVQPDMSARVLEAKMDDIQSTGAKVICTANPGCTMQLQAGVRRRGLTAEVQHVIEILSQSLDL
jgi:glycolate oxidase iron-sulfur subunit